MTTDTAKEPRGSMKYIAALIRLDALTAIKRKVDQMNAVIVEIALVYLVCRTAPTKGHRLVIVGILVGEDRAKAIVTAIMRTRGAVHAEPVELLFGLFGRRVAPSQ